MQETFLILFKNNVYKSSNCSLTHTCQFTEVSCKNQLMMGHLKTTKSNRETCIFPKQLGFYAQDELRYHFWAGLWLRTEEDNLENFVF